MLEPSLPYLSPGTNAWQLIAATLVGLMSVPGLAVLYGGLIKRKFAVNSALMVLYAFAMVLIVWILWGYRMGFGVPAKLGPGILSSLIGIPGTVLSGHFLQGQANIPLISSAMPHFRYPSSTLIYFQFVFAAITPALLAGAVLGRMNFKAWMLFVPIWSTIVYSVQAFWLWGGGWLAQLGAVDYSGGYVIHVAAGVSGFVLAWVIGPRLKKDRLHNPSNNMMISLLGAGILWLGWNGFNGGDPYFPNSDAALAVLNTNIAAATAMLTWMFVDMFSRGKATLGGAINGMVSGLVAITPAAGYVNGVGAIIIGVASGLIPWITMTLLGNKGLFRRVDDSLGVVHTHAVAGAVGGLLTGVLADPAVTEYVGVHTASVSVTGLAYGNPHQLLVQFIALAVIVAYSGVMTFVVAKLVGAVVPLRVPDRILEHGDEAMHGEIASDDRPVPHHELHPIPALETVTAEEEMEMP